MQKLLDILILAKFSAQRPEIENKDAHLNIFSRAFIHSFS